MEDAFRESFCWIVIAFRKSPECVSKVICVRPVLVLMVTAYELEFVGIFRNPGFKIP